MQLADRVGKDEPKACQLTLSFRISIIPEEMGLACAGKEDERDGEACSWGREVLAFREWEQRSPSVAMTKPVKARTPAA